MNATFTLQFGAMDDRLKSLLYMGVGLASTSRKAKALLDKMEVEGRLSEEEGKRLVGEITDELRSTGNGFKNEVADYLDGVFEQLDTPTRREYHELKERVARLEAILREKGYDI